MTKPQEIMISVVSILVCAMACVAYSEVESPSWFIETLNDDNYYYGVGYSTESRAAADAKARQKLILGIAATIHVEVEQSSQSVDDGNSEKIEGEFRTQSRSYATQELLPEVTILRRSPDPIAPFYALARLPRKTYRDQMKQKHTKVQEIAASGDRSLANGHVSAALKM